MFTTFKIFCAALCLTACVSVADQSVNSVSTAAKAPETAAPTSSMPRDGADIPAPQQFKEFCAKSPEECVLPTTADVMAAISAYNREIHALVTPAEEEGDTWNTLNAPGKGDCEDFALTLRSKLRKQFPEYSGAFLLATAYTEMNQYHAVLTIETDRGTLVCDIRYDSCASWENFPYAWRLREIAGSANWRVLGPYQMTATDVAAIEAKSGRS